MRSSLLALSLRSTRTVLRTNKSIFTGPKLHHPFSIRCFTSKKDVESSKKDDKVPKKGLFTKIKDLWKEYGYKAVLCYASLYFLNLGGLAIALETDVLRLHDYGFDAPAILDMVCGKYEELTGRKELGVIIHENPRYGILAIALFLNDFFGMCSVGAHTDES